MPRRVDEVELVDLSVLGLVFECCRLGFDRNAALAFKIHAVEDLFAHFAVGKTAAALNESIGQGGFAVVDVGDDRKVSNVLHRLKIKCGSVWDVSGTSSALWRRGSSLRRRKGRPDDRTGAFGDASFQVMRRRSVRERKRGALQGVVCDFFAARRRQKRPKGVIRPGRREPSFYQSRRVLIRAMAYESALWLSEAAARNPPANKKRFPPAGPQGPLTESVAAPDSEALILRSAYKSRSNWSRRSRRNSSSLRGSSSDALHSRRRRCRRPDPG